MTYRIGTTSKRGSITSDVTIVTITDEEGWILDRRVLPTIATSVADVVKAMAEGAPGAAAVATAAQGPSAPVAIVGTSTLEALDDFENAWWVAIQAALQGHGGV